MSRFNHVSLTLTGRFKPGSAWDGETAQVGFRIAAWPMLTSEPDTDGILPERDCSVAYEIYEGVDFTGVIGFLGEGAYWSKDDQVEACSVTKTLATGLCQQMDDKFEWTTVKLAPINLQGRIAAASTQFYFKTPVTAGSGAGDMLPPQVAVAVSLRTAVPGRRGRGRIFVPAIKNASREVTGKVGATAQDKLGNAVKTYLNGIGGLGSPDIDYRVVVTSAGNARYVLPHQVRVGNFFDTQRRRRANVRETYKSY